MEFGVSDWHLKDFVGVCQFLLKIPASFAREVLAKKNLNKIMVKTCPRFKCWKITIIPWEDFCKFWVTSYIMEFIKDFYNKNKRFFKIFLTFCKDFAKNLIEKTVWEVYFKDTLRMLYLYFRALKFNRSML